MLIAVTDAGSELTLENWEEKTAGKYVFVKFAKPFCPTCSQVVDSWTKLSHIVSEDPEASNLVLGEVDCIGRGQELCERFKVDNRYLAVRGGPGGTSASPAKQLKAYTGDKEAEAMLAWMKSNIARLASDKREL
eukprot:gnl/TRDRNA2_/TRDRNA2_100401_c0_seq1.p1 gnl/TRDRNA2_/TRDRNA2_100401_c0~~gnl/TRDRNA2_/TRDRNA2_100401_c0_seq1.p1  ORF type:complete len:134 (+),score=17.55 gnl/TRDRNA2_/TRDRNA2_100401_c0_seq1:357-758(+)